jgi:hypothetical protein
MSSVINTADLPNPVLPAAVGVISPASFDLSKTPQVTPEAAASIGSPPFQGPTPGPVAGDEATQWYRRRVGYSLGTPEAKIDDLYWFAAQQGFDLGSVWPDCGSDGLRLTPNVRLKSFARHGA